jgi:hypothetical protein
MPEHVHLWISEPLRGTPSTVLQVLNLKSEVGYCGGEVSSLRFLAPPPENRLLRRTLSFDFGRISPVEIQLRRSWILSGPFSIRRQENHFKSHGLRRSLGVQVGNSGSALHGGDPGNAILLNGVMPTANLEIGVPGFQPKAPTSTSECRLRAVRGVRSLKEFWRPSGAQLDRARLRWKSAEGR